jgi:hypothetical protein
MDYSSPKIWQWFDPMEFWLAVKIVGRRRHETQVRSGATHSHNPIHLLIYCSIIFLNTSKRFNTGPTGNVKSRNYLLRSYWTRVNNYVLPGVFPGESVTKWPRAGEHNEKNYVVRSLLNSYQLLTRNKQTSYKMVQALCQHFKSLFLSGFPVRNVL